MRKGIAAGCSFIQFGNGPEKLAVFPPIYDALFDIADFSLYFRYLFGAFARTHTVYIISRRHKLSVGYFTRDMARDYAEFFAAKIGGPAAIMGLSLGGMIAQYFALDYPEYAQKLVIAGSGCRMGPEGLAIARRWIPWAREGKWRELHEDSMSLSYTGLHYFFSEIIKHYFVAHLEKSVKDPSDFIISGQAGMLHDFTSQLPNLSMPVFLIGGSDDLFFPANLLGEMDSAIKDSHLFMVEGAKHAVFEQYRRKCSKAILEFIKGPVTETKVSRPPLY